jgi:hypothetical protein
VGLAEGQTHEATGARNEAIRYLGRGRQNGRGEGRRGRRSRLHDDAGGPGGTGSGIGGKDGGKPSGGAKRANAHAYHGSVDVNATFAKSELNTLAEEILALLKSNPAAEVQVTVEIEANFPDGAGDSMQRNVTENAKTLRFKSSGWG